MSTFQITLPDGSVQSLTDGARPIDVAQKISQRLADDAIAARVNGNLWDLNRPFESDSSLLFLLSLIVSSSPVIICCIGEFLSSLKDELNKSGC